MMLVSFWWNVQIYDMFYSEQTFVNIFKNLFDNNHNYVYKNICENKKQLCFERIPLSWRFFLFQSKKFKVSSWITLKIQFSSDNESNTWYFIHEYIYLSSIWMEVRRNVDCRNVCQRNSELVVKNEKNRLTWHRKWILWEVDKVIMLFTVVSQSKEHVIFQRSCFSNSNTIMICMSVDQNWIFDVIIHRNYDKKNTCNQKTNALNCLSLRLQKQLPQIIGDFERIESSISKLNYEMGEN